MNAIKIKNEKFTYDHLCFQNGSRHPHAFMRHAHNEYELIFFEKGEAIYAIEDRKYTLKENDLVFIRPMMYHYIELKENSEYRRVNIAFDETFLPKEVVESVPDRMEILNCPSNSPIAENFRKMDYYSAAFDEDAFALLLEGLLTEIFLNMRAFKDDFISIPCEISPIAAEILDYINANLMNVRSLDDVCDRFYITQSYLFKLFKTQLKISPKKYVIMKKLSRARALLRNGKKPTEVYSECGFETYTGFYKHYKQVFDCVPSDEKHI